MSWERKKLGELLRPSGNTRAGNTDYPVLSITMQEGLVDQSSKFKKRIASRDTASYRVVYTNELVVGFPIDEGVLGFQTKYPAGIVSPAYGIWKLALPNETYIPYLEGYLRSDVARAIYASKMRGGVARRRTISKDEFLDIEIPLPPLDEQKRIAAVLDKADALRRQRQESLQLSEKLLQSVFIDMFGDPVTNPKGWPVIKSSQLYADKPRLGTMKPAKGEGNLVVRVGELGKEAVALEKCGRVELKPEEVQRFTLFSGDTLLARAIGSQAQLGKCSYFDGHPEIVVADSHVMRLRPDPEKCDPYWFYSLLAAPFGRKLIQAKGGATAVQFNINGTQASDLDIPLPPKPLQTSFVELARRLKEQSQNQELSAKQADLFFSATQQRAFRGELDLSRLVLDPSADTPALIAPAQPVTKPTNPKASARFLQTPAALEPALKKLELTVRKGDSIPWSLDYFKYRILAAQPAPFSFEDLREKAVLVFEDPLPYEAIRDLIFDLLGQDGKPALLRQRFDLQTNDEINEVTGRKEMVFEPVP